MELESITYGFGNHCSSNRTYETLTHDIWFWRPLFYQYTNILYLLLIVNLKILVMENIFTIDTL